MITKFGEDGAILGNEIVVRDPVGVIQNLKESVGDVLAITTMKFGGLMAKAPGKSSLVRALNEDLDALPSVEIMARPGLNKPDNNIVQNKQFKDLAKEYKLTKDEQQEIHREIGKLNLDDEGLRQYIKDYRNDTP